LIRVVSEPESIYYVPPLSVRSSIPLRAIALSLLATFLCITAASSAFAQLRPEPRNPEKTASQTAEVRPTEPNEQAPADKPEGSPTFIHLVGGGKIQVEELRETRDGYWYKRGGVTTLLDPKRVVRIEKPTTDKTPQMSLAPQDYAWTISDVVRVQNFFLSRFGRPLPISAFGQSDIHNRWGLDHRQGIDVGLHPDSVEGAALVNFLRSERIPFLAFRGAIPRVATGPHIHIGRASHRYLPR
jgi:hypothetical protein